MAAEVVLINPNVLVQRSDLMTTGIPYMPVGLAYLAAQLRESGYSVSVIDAFGEAPERYRKTPDFLIRGLSPSEVVERLQKKTPLAVFVYAGAVASTHPMLDILRELRRAGPHCPVVVFENSQAVYALSLSREEGRLRKAGATHVLVGEPEMTAVSLLEKLQKGDVPAEGLLPRGPAPELDELPLPAWDLIPIRKYWALGYAHGPVEGNFLPLQTSRGCPYPCRFCIVPETTGKKWRGRSAVSVALEMETLKKTFGVAEFHIEDLNPTVSEDRIQNLCAEIIKLRLKVRWKIAAGTKIETLAKLETLDAMAEAGCRYLSFSPETGSPRLLKLMGKPFRWDFALEQVARMNRLGIRSQACFVLGFPGETPDDLAETRDYVQRLLKAGLDEIALFIAAPIPGSEIRGEFEIPDELSLLTFSPSWRTDYESLHTFRLELYRSFLLQKSLRYPHKIIRQAFNFLLRRFQTKMEMTPYRALKEFFGSWGAQEVEYRHVA